MMLRLSSLAALVLLLLAVLSSALNGSVMKMEAKGAGFPFLMREATSSMEAVEEHDIAIISVSPFKTITGEGYCVSINITVENQGSFTEIFRVVAYADTAIISQIPLSLASNNSVTLCFEWNTTGFALGNYTLSVYAIPVRGETDIADNYLKGGWVIVTMVGDVTGPFGWPDREVNKQDLALVLSKFGSTYTESRYNPNCDINNDGKVEIRDVAVTARMRAHASRSIDLWMLTPPNGGQGVHEPADLVLPQTEVSLTALVTYDERPAQNKNVTFIVRDENGTLWEMLRDETDEYGYAYTLFRMPGLNNGVYPLGKWNITASVTLADVVTTDYVMFHHDFLIRIWSVATDKAEYGHCEDVEITVDYGTHAMREESVVLAVTMADELAVPIAVALVESSVGNAEFCQYRNCTATVRLHIDAFAHAGLATAHVSFLNALPSEGGEAYTEEVATTFYILPF